MTATRQDVSREAMAWLRTPYRHQARIKGVGADCTFLAVLFADLGLIPPLSIETYSPQAHLHRQGGIYLKTVADHAKETKKPKVGDMALYWFGRDFSHGAVIVEPGWPHIIHADMSAGYIIMADGEQGTLAEAKDRKFFTVWDD